MGQTLTHGVYLPDEGERNCYSGLAANWQILDSTVGTVAEHTSQIAGKAPLVHTHTKSDITDFPVYGTTAGTICEGNDSRLSDARTPLSHTHTKSEITDFPAYGTTAGTICEGNDSRLSDARTPVAHTHTKSDVTDLLNSNFIPSADATYNIGSATYRWSSIWGISFKSKSANIDLTDSVTTGNKENWYFTSYDKNENAFFSFSNQRNHSVGSNEEHFRLKNANGGWADFYLKLTDSGEFSVALSMSTSVTNKGFRGKFVPTVHLLPAANNAYDLGSSTYKWKTLNGINPGALSLPDLNTTQTIDRTGWTYDGSTYNSIKLSSTDIDMAKNGWLYVRISSTGSSDKLSIKYNSIGDKYPTSSFGDTGGCIEVFVPVIAGSRVYLCATKDLQFCKFYPCLGNVPSGV